MTKSLIVLLVRTKSKECHVFDASDRVLTPHREPPMATEISVLFAVIVVRCPVTLGPSLNTSCRLPDSLLLNQPSIVRKLDPVGRKPLGSAISPFPLKLAALPRNGG